MKKILILILLILLSILPVNSNDINCNQFKLYDIQYNSDFDYESIMKFNDFSELERLDSVFKTVPGKFTVIRFIFHKYREDIYDIGLGDRYFLVMLKVDKSNFIQDAIFFPLHYAEIPANSVFSRLQNKVMFTNKIKLKDLNLVTKYVDSYPIGAKAPPLTIEYLNKSFTSTVDFKPNTKKIINLSLDTNLRYTYSCVE